MAAGPGPADAGPASEFVRWIQSTLNLVQQLRLPVDGVLGPQTRSAIRDFQKRRGLAVDGIVGPDTKEALLVARREAAQAARDTGQAPSAGPGPGQEPGEEQEQFLGSLATWLYGSQASQPDRSAPAYIRWVQSGLNKILGLRLAVDGIAGSQTRSAVRTFQQRQGLAADGIVGPRTEQALVAAGAGSPPGGKPAPSGPTAPTYSPTGAAQLARQILNHPNITLWPNSPVSKNSTDGADAQSNIEDTANGRPARRSNYGNAPGSTISLDPRMLQGLLALAGRYQLRVTSIAGGSHSKNSRHYAGVAFDVDQINGIRVSATNPHFRAFMQAARALGATEVIGPGSKGHDTHIHCAWPRP